MKGFGLELIVFICGAATMIVELVGSRVLAPYLGTSTFVWTSLIGVVLGCLSLGYWWGGRLADRRPDAGVLSFIIFLSGAAVGTVAVIDMPVLMAVEKSFSDLRVGSVIASLVLFGPASVLLGMVLPYSARLKITDLSKTGATVGTLYAVSTVGSIVGTFFAGFFLISRFNNTHVLLFIAAALVILSLAVCATYLSRTKAAAAVLILAGIFAAEPLAAFIRPAGFADVNTDYCRIWIYEGKHGADGRPIRVMQISNESSSAIYLDGRDLALEYTKYYDLAAHFNPDFRKALMIGGAACAYPMHFLSAYPEARIDVVEIDPEQTELAKKHFGLQDDPRLRIFHEDGRIFLNRTREKYDVILGDAFRSLYSIPHQLTTVEAVRRMHAALNEGGVVLVNVISSIEGPAGQFLRAEVATFKNVFPQVYVFAITEPQNGAKVQNLMLVAVKSDKVPQFFSRDRETNRRLERLWLDEIPRDVPVLTDEFAPVERYILPALAQRERQPNPLEKGIVSKFRESRE